MPNWCECELDVAGEEAALLRFQEAVRTEETELEATKVIPYPEEFRKLDEAADRWDEEQKRKKEANSGCEIPWAERPKDGFNSGGYEWCTDNWGTKWGFCNPEITSRGIEALRYSFRTAWSPPLPLIVRMGEMFPGLTFHLRYVEEGLSFQGILIVENGKVVKDEEVT